MSYLTVVTNTSQISSSGKEIDGGRLDKKSLPVGKIMNLKMLGLGENKMEDARLPDRIRNRTLNSDLIYFLHFLYPVDRQVFIKLV